jgi:hypothetical protein
MGETDIPIGITIQPTAKLRICRQPGCLISFDPAWRVRIPGEPAGMENLCPRCGADLSLNPFIRRASEEVLTREGDG